MTVVDEREGDEIWGPVPETFCMSTRTQLRKSVLILYFFDSGPSFSSYTSRLHQNRLSNTMSTPFLRSSRRANTPIRLQCQVPHCRRWFGNQSGLTKHTNTFHPNFSVPNHLTKPTSGGADHTTQPDDAVDPTSTHHMGIDGEAIDSRWHGPGDNVYCNYHTKLTGTMI